MPYTEELKFRTSDCDKNLKLTPSSILDLFQETAGRHCIPYGLDSPTLIKNYDATWVLTGMALNLESYPCWPGSVKIDTWTTSLKGFKALRDYTLYNDDGKNIIQGSSVWAMINLKTRRPTKMDTLNSSFEIENDIHELPNITPGKPKILDDYGEAGVIINVNRSDLDLNNHVSNIQYLVWLYTYMDNKFLDIKELSSINISYRGETYLNDELLFKTVFIDNCGYHSFINKKTNKEICIISSTWRDIN